MIWKIIGDLADGTKLCYSGLEYLHRNHILHRDLKPANVFRSEGVYKIGDMNVSKILKNGAFASTKTGSPLYTSPEVWDDSPYNEKCDVWSLGVLIY
jgi:NIMA (never in mitosis gene a)-related kinase